MDGSLLVQLREDQVWRQRPVSRSAMAPVVEQVGIADLWLAGGSASMGRLEIEKRTRPSGMEPR